MRGRVLLNDFPDHNMTLDTDQLSDEFCTSKFNQTDERRPIAPSGQPLVSTRWIYMFSTFKHT